MLPYDKQTFGAKKNIEHGFMPTFKVQGQVYHLVGSLLPQPGHHARFIQVNFVEEDDRESRMKLKTRISEAVAKKVSRCKSFIKDLKIAKYKVPPSYDSFKVVIHADKKPSEGHRGCCNAPTDNEVALVMTDQQFER